MKCRVLWSVAALLLVAVAYLLAFPREPTSREMCNEVIRSMGVYGGAGCAAEVVSIDRSISGITYSLKVATGNSAYQASLVYARRLGGYRFRQISLHRVPESSSGQ